MVEFKSQNSEVKLMPNERSRLILKGSRFKPLGIKRKSAVV